MLCNHINNDSAMKKPVRESAGMSFDHNRMLVNTCRAPAMLYIIEAGFSFKRIKPMQKYQIESPNKGFIQFKSRGYIAVIETDDVEYVGFLVDFQKIVEAAGVNYNEIVDSPDVAGRSVNLTFWRQQEEVVDKIIRQTRRELLKDNRFDHKGDNAGYVFDIYKSYIGCREYWSLQVRLSARYSFTEDAQW